MGHGNAFSKSRFYEIFDWNSQSIFRTRSREVHARKRKWLSATFSARSIRDFERFMTDALLMYGRQMENLVDGHPAGRYEYPVDEEVRKRIKSGEGVMDATIWNAFLAFDIIGDLVKMALHDQSSITDDGHRHLVGHLDTPKMALTAIMESAS